MALEDALNLAPTLYKNITSNQEILVPSPAQSNLDSEAEADFSYARRNLRAIIEDGKQALDAALDVAKSSEHPRAFEVTSQLISSLASVNKDLIDLQKKKRDLSAASDKSEASGVSINNAVFVGSTADLQKMINARKA